MYNYIGAAAMSFYSVLVRSVKPFESPQTTNQLKALLNDLLQFDEVLLTNTSDYSEVTEKNVVYLCDPSLGAVSIDLSNAGFALAGNEGDVLIFKAEDISNSIDIIDENSRSTSLAVAIGDYVVLKYHGTKWEYYFNQENYDDNQKNYFTEIGALEDGPEIKTETGTTKPTNKAGIMLRTKKISFLSNDINVSKESSDFFDSLTSAGNIDICFYNDEEPEKSKFLLDFKVDNYENIKGGKGVWSILPLSGEREVNLSEVSNHLKLFKDNTVV